MIYAEDVKAIFDHLFVYISDYDVMFATLFTIARKWIDLRYARPIIFSRL